MAVEDTAIIIALAVVAAIAITACVALLILMQRRNKSPLPQPKQPDLNPTLISSYSSSPSLSSPFKVSKSVQYTDAAQAKNELRILDLEREILGDAIRKLYEANAEGKITEAEREKLAGSYKNRMMSVKEAITKDESIVALHELESMQEDLMKLFSERFGELSGKVEELRGRIDVRPIKEVKVQMPKAAPVVPDQMEAEEESAQPAAEKKDLPKKPRKPASERSKTEAEQRIDQIRNQIDEVMNKLGQMEMD
jgi:hypothetical protein